MRWAAAALLWTMVAAPGVLEEASAPTSLASQASSTQAEAAYFIRSLDNPRERREARGDILDSPTLPGSVVKPIALVAALERGIISAQSTHMCRRVATVGGRKFVCAHPDLRRPLTPAEALAYSCNDFFVSLAPRLSRDALNATRIAAGLPPIGSGTPLPPAIVGLDGPHTTPRALIDVIARVVGAGSDKPVPMRPETKAVLLEGLRGAADYGTASALKEGDVSALAKTGSVVMPNGGALGLVVALVPADRPTRAIVVAAPGAAGLDAAAIAADVIRGRGSFSASVAERSDSAKADRLQKAATNRQRAPEKIPDPFFVRLGRTTADGRTRVENVAVDTYIAQVLAGEGQPRASDAAQDALAITARTFALANRNRHRAEGFDLCDTTHCQVLRPATATTRRAAEATSGRVLLHQGQPAFVFYSAWCGGQTELASEVWPGAADYSYEPSLEDDACDDEPQWSSEVRADQIEAALRAAGLRGSRLRDLRVLSRNKSDRVARLRVEGFTPSDISGHEFRMAVGRVAGWQTIKSTAFAVDRTGSGYRFRGRGFGHGVGLCVIGAGRRASRGASAEEILRFYFPGLSVGTLTSAPEVTTAAVPKPAPGDISLALPAAEEGERAALLSLIRRSRDEISKFTGVKTPTLRVTVHPTVDSFGRATGQSWWVSGATHGASIDLLPITILRQQGQVDRTIRHEVAHALLDAALAKKPMWVREGAAMYFARPPGGRPDAGDTDRGRCPGDPELLRPVSVGSQREAYARAEACFARAIAEGKRWNEIP